MKYIQRPVRIAKLQQLIQYFCARSVFAVLLTFFVGASANATLINPGFDLFHTPGDGSSYVDLGGFGLGNVILEGNRSLLGSGLGNTDTVVARKDPIDPFNLGDTGTIDIELVALSLQSVTPVDLTPLGGPFVGMLADMYITINHTQPYFDAQGNPVFDGTGVTNKFPNLPQPDMTLLSTGTMTISHTTAMGGTFTSNFPNIFADAIFTVVGGDPNDLLDIMLTSQAPAITLNSSGTWTHDKPDNYPTHPMFPDGDFFIVDIDHEGPHQPDPAIVSAPSTLVLLCLGLSVFGWSRRKKEC
jgi:hypothetical protein